MKSVICVFGVLSVITASGDLNPTECKSQGDILKPPFCFVYYKDFDFNAMIKFSNLSPDVTYKIYETDDSKNYYLATLPEHKEHHNYTIRTELRNDAIRIYIELRINAEWCKNMTIIEGREGEQYNNLCLKSTQSCIIEVDLKNVCLESFSWSIWYKYVIPSVIVLIVIILVIYICVKKYSHRNWHPVETMELNTYSTANQVVYADLSLVHGDNQPPGRGEESPYAQIIGVLKPVDGELAIGTIKTVKN